MIPEKSLVVYKNHPALVSGVEGEKINISVFRGETARVREKDIEFLHPGPCTFRDLEENAPAGSEQDAWELLLEADDSGASLKELAELIYGTYSPRTVWAAYELLREDLYFTGNIASIRPRSRKTVEEDIRRRGEKQKEGEERAAFLEKIKKLPPLRGGVSLLLDGEAAVSLGKLSSGDFRFLHDVEALARGRSDKSRTLKELGWPETPEDAHRLLLASGAWTVWENPHPERHGLNRESASIEPPPPPDEERLDLTGMAAYAIDNPWSDDPDDAISLEGPDADGRHCLWVHVADPAASILPGSSADMEARNRGATLYLPEGSARMLSAGAHSIFTLGSREISPALSFKITLKRDLNIDDIEIFPSFVKVTRMSYAEADTIITGTSASMLAELASLMERNEERRLETGAVFIELPEAQIQVYLGKDSGKGENRVSVEPVDYFRSTVMVRECMILAGEGAARWALQRQLPFPYISQEAGELPGKRLPGFAGAWQLRRCMRSRVLSVKPAVHWGLGLDEYTQVTSSLRRYTDLVCHQQIRARLGGGAYRGLDPLSSEEVLFRISAAEAAASAVSRAERASKVHWLGVYLLDKKGSVWDGIVLDRKGGKGTVIIPSLGLETQVSLKGNEEPNDKVRLSLSSARIPEGEISFSVA